MIVEPNLELIGFKPIGKILSINNIVITSHLLSSRQTEML